MNRSFRRPDGVYELAPFRQRRILLRSGEILGGFALAVALAASFALSLGLGALLAGAVGTFLVGRLIYRIRTARVDTASAPAAVKLRVLPPAPRLECGPAGKLQDMG